MFPRQRLSGLAVTSIPEFVSMTSVSSIDRSSGKSDGRLGLHLLKVSVELQSKIGT